MAEEFSMNGRKKDVPLLREFTEKFNYRMLLFRQGDGRSVDPGKSLA